VIKSVGRRSLLRIPRHSADRISNWKESSASISKQKQKEKAMEPIAVHYPTEIRKYTGSLWTVKGKKGDTFCIKIMNADIRYQKNFKTMAEAVEALKQKNIEHGLLIKNVIKEYPEYMTCELTRDQRFMFSKGDIETVQKHCWCCSHGYAVTFIGDKMHKFHNILLGFQPTEQATLDHIDCNRLNNSRENLRVASKRTQNINQSLQKSNTSGIKGVFYDRQGNKWVATWQDGIDQQKTKYFSVRKYGEPQAKQMAINHRRLMEETLPHYILAYARV